MCDEKSKGIKAKSEKNIIIKNTEKKLWLSEYFKLFAREDLFSISWISNAKRGRCVCIALFIYSITNEPWLLSIR